jgi:capsular polysaccharide export protein
MQQIAVLTSGLWRLRAEVEVLSGLTPVRWTAWTRPHFAAVVGWGHAPTADRARRLAREAGTPYLAFEDGPLRSVKPGPSQPPMSLVMDRLGVYYRAGARSELTELMSDRAWWTPEVKARAERAIALLRELRLSKYNSGPERTPDNLGLDPAANRRVLVVDQVRGDASIGGALADAAAFTRMLEAAIDENPDQEIVVKVHPDVLAGRRSGYFSELRPNSRVKVVAENLNPWSLLAAVDKVYTVSSGLGFEAVLAGKQVVCFGSPYYSGWGFTDDRGQLLNRGAPASPAQLFAAYYLKYARYFDAYSRQLISFEHAAEQLAFLRDRFVENPHRAVCYRITAWKRPSINRMLDGPAGAPAHVRSADRAAVLAKKTGGPVVAWSSRDSTRIGKACATAGVPLMRVEDGFIRSAGLGASFVAPLSLVFDRRGIYYDPRAASDLEALLIEADIPAPLLERAKQLRQKLVAARTTKYNLEGRSELSVDLGGRPLVLVVGQVEDDASIRHGSPNGMRNLNLLRAARERHPDAVIFYKPHPDVEAGFRRGRILPKVAHRYAERIAAKAGIIDLIQACDRLETITSLAGFEALLRGKPVTTHGQPFYAGWGLTEDLCPLPRRSRMRSLDELVAAALILYPRYLDPVSGLPCGPELVIDRIAEAGRGTPTRAARALRLAGTTAGRLLFVARSIKALGRLP